MAAGSFARASALGTRTFGTHACTFLARARAFVTPTRVTPPARTFAARTRAVVTPTRVTRARAVGRTRAIDTATRVIPARTYVTHARSFVFLHTRFPVTHAETRHTWLRLLGSEAIPVV